MVRLELSVARWLALVAMAVLVGSACGDTCGDAVYRLSAVSGCNTMSRNVLISRSTATPLPEMRVSSSRSAIN